MSVADRDLAVWREAIDREAVRRQQADAESLRRFAVAIGASPDVETRQPVLGHWAWFLDTPEDDGIGEDGHPRRGGFMPSVTLSRRMFAAATLRFERPVTLGAIAEMRSRIRDVQAKSGGSGDLVFVDVERVLSQDDLTCLIERQTIVYREASATVSLPTPSAAGGEATWQPSEVNLYRFSAATFNGHRIHYDRTYATQVEHYPDLVVQGPFTAARLAELACRDGAIAGIRFRLEAPLFVNQPIQLRRDPPHDYRAIRCDGVPAVTLAVERP